MEAHQGWKVSEEFLHKCSVKGALCTVLHFMCNSTTAGRDVGNSFFHYNDISPLMVITKKLNVNYLNL